MIRTPATDGRASCSCRAGLQGDSRAQVCGGVLGGSEVFNQPWGSRVASQVVGGKNGRVICVLELVGPVGITESYLSPKLPYVHPCLLNCNWQLTCPRSGTRVVCNCQAKLTTSAAPEANWLGPAPRLWWYKTLSSISLRNLPLAQQLSYRRSS